MSGSGIDGAIGTLGQCPDNGLIAGEEGIDLGGEGEPAFAAQREAVESSADEIRIGVQLPSGGAAGEGGRGERRAQNGGAGGGGAGEGDFFSFTPAGFGA